MVPYGINLPLATALKDPPKNRPLRVLHAGAIDLRKGAPDLLTAARAFHPEELELRMAGQIDVRPGTGSRNCRQHTVVGPSPREEMGRSTNGLTFSCWLRLRGLGHCLL